MNTKYNWVNIPKEITHIAYDQDGSLYGFHQKPRRSQIFRVWYDTPDETTIYLGKVEPIDWENSLQERPTFSDAENFDWDEFAEALKNELGESLVEPDGDEKDPYNWFLINVTVGDIVDFIKKYKPNTH